MDQRIRRRMYFALMSAGLAAALAGSANAQSWRTVPTDADSSRVLAVQSGAGGATVARCDAGVFSVAIVLPAARTDDASAFDLRIDGAPAERAFWTQTENRAGLLSHTPARLARKLARAGRLELAPAGDDGWNAVYGVDLPTDPTPLLGLMSDCGVPTEDSRDALTVLHQPAWTRLPSGDDMARLYPDRSLNGRGHLLCVITPSGRPQDCEVTYETPPGAGFGEATLGLATNFRLDRRQAEEAAGSLVSIVVRWTIQ